VWYGPAMPIIRKPSDHHRRLWRELSDLVHEFGRDAVLSALGVGGTSHTYRPDQPMRGKSHRGDPETSHEAARRNSVARGTQRAAVLRALVELGEYGATDFEISEALGLLRTAAGTRRKELAEMGYCEQTERRRVTDTGSDAFVHVVTTAGIDALSLLDLNGWGDNDV